jgi:hypothetical protein
MSESDGSGRQKQGQRDLNSRLLHAIPGREDGQDSGDEE